MVLLLVSVSGASVPAFANPSDVTPTEEVTPVVTEQPTCTPTPTEVTPTPTEEVTPTPTSGPTSTPTPGPTATPTPGEVLSVKTMAKTGTLGQTLMNLSGIFGMIALLAGSFIYAKKQKNS